MAEPLKNMYNATFFQDLCTALSQVMPAFDAPAFMHAIYDAAWDERPLKARMRHITTTLHAHLPADYREALAVLRQVAPLLSHYTFQVIFFPDFVEMYGLDDWDASLPALELFTQYSSAEFAVRPFIMQDAPRMMTQMQAWAAHDNPHVRRLASEGCRPRLPWAMALPAFKRDPAPILPILEALKQDVSEYVRRSVANNLNDIAKDHPDVVMTVLQRWSQAATPETQWVIRRALRTLLKDGHSDALTLLGYAEAAPVRLTAFTLTPSLVRMGETLTFTFEIESQADTPQSLMIDYVVYFMKARGTQTAKVFKLAQRPIQPGETLRLEKRHTFRPITTRTYHAGAHALALKINGQESERLPFHLAL